jgi:hypothetical protein
VWTPTASTPFVAGRSGVGEELGVYDDLLRCVLPNERVEYGVVEHRFAEIAPATYAELIRRYGHASLAPTRYSASSFLSHALGQLYRERLLDRNDVPATGYWRYLRQVPAFAQPATMANVRTTSWESFATEHGIDPQVWPSTAG